MAVVAVSAFQVASGNQAAGSNAVLQVKGMASVTVLNSQAGKQSPDGFLPQFVRFHGQTLAHPLGVQDTVNAALCPRVSGCTAEST